MFKLRYGYLISGIITGLVLIVSYLGSLPDGKLHLVFCDVGQGDAAYIRFPDGRDMVVDGGPNDKIVGCLSRHMPFWDRALDMVILTHPQRDHMQGLLTVLDRYDVSYVVKSDVHNQTEGYAAFVSTIKAKKIPVKLVTAGEVVAIGESSLSMVWPSPSVLGATTETNVNDASIVFWLRYGTFDALFTGDMTLTSRMVPQAIDGLEVLKVPHHGSKTGMTRDVVEELVPRSAVISVGRNSYGHPSPEVLQMLEEVGALIHRTDKTGDIEVVSDGATWQIIP